MSAFRFYIPSIGHTNADNEPFIASMEMDSNNVISMWEAFYYQMKSTSDKQANPQIDDNGNMKSQQALLTNDPYCFDDDALFPTYTTWKLTRTPTGFPGAPSPYYSNGMVTDMINTAGTDYMDGHNVADITYL
jgi:hypothetical protein